MKDSGLWIGRLEGEIARELGQPVSLTAGGEVPEASRSFCDRLDLPGARIELAVDSEELPGVLAEGRLIEPAGSDAGTVRELWTAILASVCVRLGGSLLAPPGGDRPNLEGCSFRLGKATMRMGFRVEPQLPSLRPETPGNYDLLLEVELDASVRFGSREMELGELLELGPGDVVELDRNISDPVDLIVGNKIVARGEVVLVNGNFGLRISEVAEPIRRLESIRCLA